MREVVVEVEVEVEETLVVVAASARAKLCALPSRWTVEKDRRSEF